MLPVHCSPGNTAGKSWFLSDEDSCVTRTFVFPPQAPWQGHLHIHSLKSLTLFTFIATEVCLDSEHCIWNVVSPSLSHVHTPPRLTDSRLGLAFINNGVVGNNRLTRHHRKSPSWLALKRELGGTRRRLVKWQKCKPFREIWLGSWLSEAGWGREVIGIWGALRFPANPVGRRRAAGGCSLVLPFPRVHEKAEGCGRDPPTRKFREEWGREAEKGAIRRKACLTLRVSQEWKLLMFIVYDICIYQCHPMHPPKKSEAVLVCEIQTGTKWTEWANFQISQNAS